jgi:hypothetical protein
LFGGTNPEMPFLQIKQFPKELLARIDAAAKLLDIKREQVVTELLEEATKDVKELEDKLRDARKRRLNRT